MRQKGPYAMEFARLAVPDVGATKSFLDKFVGLDPVEGNFDRVYMRAANDHHSIELIDAAPGADVADVAAIGYSVESKTVLDELRANVAGAGHDVHDLDEATTQWVTTGFGVDDPNGLRFEFFTEYSQFADVPFRLFRPNEVVHPFLGTPKWRETVDFFVNVLRFMPSDYIRDNVAFLRSENRYHHSLAIRKTETFEVEHICFIMQNLDHVMRGRAKAIYANIPIASDLVNHSGSESIAFYMHDPAHGPRFELCDGHVLMSEEQHETHKPRQMSLDPRNIDIWRPAADDWAGF
jgi:2,3-dihydroxy-p-cumate/2,3-dihydroxybenzoate 3,4-dioxygenase